MPARSVAEKLLVRPGGRAWVSDPARSALLGPLPEGASLVTSLDEAQVALVVVESAADVRAAVATWGDALAAVPALWVAYPKGGRSDVNRDSLWPILAEHGLRPVAQVALDDTWSALRFRPLAPGEAPFNPR